MAVQKLHAVSAVMAALAVGLGGTLAHGSPRDNEGGDAPTAVVPAAPAKEEPPPDARIAWGKAENGLRLGVRVLGPDRVALALENAGRDDAVVNLGIMLANGKNQLPTAVRLVVTDEVGRTRILLHPEPPIAGRVDPFVVPLAAGCQYVLPCTLAKHLDAGVYKVAAEFVGEKITQTNADTTGLALFSYWTGTARSGEVRFTVPAVPEQLASPNELAGSWGAVSVEKAGKAREFTGRWVIKDGTIAESLQEWAIGEYTYRIDPSKTPTEIDLSPGGGPGAGKTFEGSYKIEKDILTVCYD